MSQIIRQIKQKKPNLGFLPLAFILILILVTWAVGKLMPNGQKTPQAQAQGCWTTPSGGSDCGGSDCGGGDCDCDCSCGSSSCSCGCFRENVLVATGFNQDGTLKSEEIQNLKIGDVVLGTRSGSSFIKKLETYPVQIMNMRIHEPVSREFIEITTKSGLMIESTTTHPFVVSKNGESVKAQDIQSGMSLFSSSPVRRIFGKKTFQKEIVLHSVRRTDCVSVYHPKTGSGNFLVSKDGKNFFLVLNKT